MAVASISARLPSLNGKTVPRRFGLFFWSKTLGGIGQQRANISGKMLRGDEKVEKPAPFPYKTKRLNLWNSYFDDTLERIDENSKILVIEGSVAAGKTTLAKALAEALDMLYIPEASMDMVYINDYGYDLRDYKSELPDAVRPYDVKDFYKNPAHPSAANFQILMYRTRYSQYLDALTHLFNTGQGVVMDRCVYSDFCFLETMFKQNYISRGAYNAYYEIKKNTIAELMRPHLIIYLDVPVDIIQERIKKRGEEHEVNTKVLSKEYLQNLADVYKFKYLREIGKHAELLVYDWKNFGDVEVVVEDIERIDFDHYDKYDPKMQDWQLFDGREWDLKRYDYTNHKENFMSFFNVPVLDVPELIWASEDVEKLQEVSAKVPGNRYATGYNADLGDKGVYFK